MADTVLQLSDVRKTYGDVRSVQTEVLHGLDVQLQRGEFVALIGPSGSGKSTLLHIMGLLEKPTSGSVILLNNDTHILDDRALTELRGNHIGFVFQFHYLLPAFTALENVLMPMAVKRGRIDAEMRTTASLLLERVDLAKWSNHKPAKLSGGQQQRVAIARALAMKPSLVLADEPTGNLDTQTGESAFALMREFNREFGTTFLIVTHDPRIAQRCDRLLTMVDGKLV